MTELALKSSQELTRSRFESINLLLEDLELAQPKASALGFKGRLYVYRTWLGFGVLVLSLLALIGSGIAFAGPDSLDPDWAGWLMGLSMLGGFGSAAYIAVESEGGGFNLKAQLKKWQFEQATLLTRLLLTLDDHQKLAQYSVRSVRGLDRVEILLVRTYRQECSSLSSYIIEGKELEDIEYALAIRQEAVEAAERLNRQARVGYLEKNWKEWEELLLPYDSVARQARELHQVLDQA